MNKFGPVGLSALLLGAITFDRAGPEKVEDLSLAALVRFRQQNYRSKSLDAVYHALYNMSDKEWGDTRTMMIARDRGATHDLDAQMRPRSRDF